MRKALIAANWKCHGSLAMVDEYAAVLEHSAKVETVVFPPAVFVERYATQAAQKTDCGVAGYWRRRIRRTTLEKLLQKWHARLALMGYCWTL